MYYVLPWILLDKKKATHAPAVNKFKMGSTENFYTENFEEMPNYFNLTKYNKRFTPLKPKQPWQLLQISWYKRDSEHQHGYGCSLDIWKGNLVLHCAFQP